MMDRKKGFRTMSNAPMLHCWPIGTIKVVIGKLFRLESLSLTLLVRAEPYR